MAAPKVGQQAGAPTPPWDVVLVEKVFGPIFEVMENAGWPTIGYPRFPFRYDLLW